MRPQLGVEVSVWDLFEVQLELRPHLWNRALELKTVQKEAQNIKNRKFMHLSISNDTLG